MSPAYTRSSKCAAEPANDNGRKVRAPSDWQACEPKSLVRHMPTHTIFQLFTRPGLAPDHYLALEDFDARLVHVCEGAASRRRRS